MSGRESQAHSSDNDLQEWICRENIKNLSAQFAATNDEARRKVLSRLLAEQEEKLDGMRNPPSKSDI